MKIVTFGSIKGGVGKTSMAAMTANCLAAAGFKVLVIDMDWNNSLSFYYLDKEGAEMAREKNIALEPERMTAEQKENLLRAFHPDYKEEGFEVLKIGANKGGRVPTELAEILQAKSRINKELCCAVYIL